LTSASSLGSESLFLVSLRKYMSVEIEATAISVPRSTIVHTDWPTDCFEIARSCLTHDEAAVDRDRLARHVTCSVAA
jgi:hypothetical protein